METRRTRSSVSGNFGKSHREDQARQIWVRIQGRGQETEGLEKEVGEKVGLERGTEVYMLSEGRKVGWRELGRLEEWKLLR